MTVVVVHLIVAVLAGYAAWWVAVDIAQKRGSR